MSPEKSRPTPPCRGLFDLRSLMVLLLVLSTASLPASAALEAPDPICPASAATAGPAGFAIAGFVDAEEMGNADWVYSWSYANKSYYDNPTFLPMVWGGPMGEEHNCGQRYGNTWRPGCANGGDNGGGTGCSSDEIQAFASGVADFVRASLTDNRPSNACGRTWLIFNEPDLRGPEGGCADSSDLDPVQAAAIFEALVAEIRAVDPTARFYCCGTIVDSPDLPVEERTSLAWMAAFLGAISDADTLDGFHVHNYGFTPYDASNPSLVADAAQDTIGRMELFREFVAEQSRFSDRPITVTESSNWGWPDRAPEQAGFMQGMAEWLVGPQQGYEGAAWFVSQAGYSAPCAHGDECAFSTRAVWPAGSGSTESLTAASRYFNFTTETNWQTSAWKRNGSWLSSYNAHYARSGGPCEDRPRELCNFETRTVFDDGTGGLIESITAFGEIYNFTLAPGDPAPIPWPDNGAPLYSVPWYVEWGGIDGPCADALPPTLGCYFDTRTVFDEGDQKIEYITAGGKFFELTWPAGASQPATPMRSGWIGDEDRYSAICAAQPGTCRLDTHTRFRHAGFLLDSVTVGNAYYNFAWNAATEVWEPLIDNGSSLDSVAWYTQNPIFTSLFEPFDGPPTELGEQWLAYSWDPVTYGQLNTNHVVRRLNLAGPQPLGGFTDPIVMIGAPTLNGDEAAVMRIDNVDATGFDYFLQEWDYLNGT
ncbi:MAG: glycoside hydrolase family protein, partial [Holophagales bacterium]|nr:glycoside hydrolase family protein [Holophagales bacterium]